MSFFDECENALVELKGTPASNITHTVKAWSDDNDSGMVDSLLTVLTQLREERDENVRTASVVCGACGLVAGVVLTGSIYWLQVRKNRQDRKKEEHAAIKKVKQEIQAVEQLVEPDQECTVESELTNGQQDEDV